MKKSQLKQIIREVLAEADQKITKIPEAIEVKSWQDINKYLSKYGVRYAPEEFGLSPRVRFPDDKLDYFRSFRDFKESVLIPLSQGKDVDRTYYNAEKRGSIIAGVDPARFDKLKNMGYEIKKHGRTYSFSEFANYK